MKDLDWNIIMLVVNTLIIPLVIYFFKSILSRIDKLSNSVDKLDEKLESYGNRITVIETQCQIRSSKSKKC